MKTLKKKKLGFLCSLLDSGTARPLRYLSQITRHRRWSSWTLSAHQVSPVTISASFRTVSALQASPVTISASPRLLGFHLALRLLSASWLSPSRLSLAPQDSMCLGCSFSTARPRYRRLGCSSCSTSSRWLSVPFGTPALCLDLTVGLTPLVGLSCSFSTARPRRCLSPFDGSQSFQLVWVSCFCCFASFIFRLVFDCWLRYYLLFCLICKLD